MGSDSDSNDSIDVYPALRSNASDEPFIVGIPVWKSFSREKHFWSD
jgi:hypothetical protein